MVVEKDGVKYDVNGNILGLADESSSNENSTTNTIDKKESENTDEVITDDTNNLSKDENSDTNTNNTFN